jgi:SPX domain protein involved in polyphosphate accumulation
VLSTIKMNFRTLNMLAFIKILKKFDKVSKWVQLFYKFYLSVSFWFGIYM